MTSPAQSFPYVPRDASLVAEIAGLTMGDRFKDEFEGFFWSWMLLCRWGGASGDWRNFFVQQLTCRGMVVSFPPSPPQGSP